MPKPLLRGGVARQCMGLLDGAFKPDDVKSAMTAEKGLFAKRQSLGSKNHDIFWACVVNFAKRRAYAAIHH